MVWWGVAYAKIEEGFVRVRPSLLGMGNVRVYEMCHWCELVFANGPQGRC